ncbi:hypothetical protein HYH03_016607 [Edaphochlamys debaryana]|uniref:Uncharacterized protein n=1 Tax=Edaphochlamys debaryana TaxID=47281 RepID=A0A835XRB7_9CHLO|nr:hypothetical protein HYH03_016607 [Edaphochlamys debaryana]|eukprot:KAG2484654.1 hypothetical protein HYH03_016607 [Edaphochlamys debaryana]
MTYQADGRKSMQMYVGPRREGQSSDGAAAGGAAAAIASLPAPTDGSVRIGVAGGELVAVAQFEGNITPTNAEAVRRRLIAALKQDGIQLAEADAAGRFRCAQYGAVYTLGERLNELMLQVRV